MCFFIFSLVSVRLVVFRVFFILFVYDDFFAVSRNEYFGDFKGNFTFVKSVWFLVIEKF